jgi:hypothetical protein
MSVIVIVADGARPDVLADAMDRGVTPALASFRDEGGLHTVTTAFPSVTGPAYTPFLMGRFPGPVGLPGLRWYDRERTRIKLPGNSRSYVGPEMRLVDTDLDPAAPTIFEIAGSSLAALNVIGRGLPAGHRIGSSLWFAAKTGLTHFTGNVQGWLSIDRNIAAQVAKRIRADRPDFVFAALTGVDKTSHSRGHSGPHVDSALRIVDHLAEEIRADADSRGSWKDTHVWIVSDHGHSPVTQHEDLAGFVRQLGFRTIAHPFVFSRRGEAAVMVSGNAMAHIYLDLALRKRPSLSQLAGRWKTIQSALLARESVDLMIVPGERGECEIHGSRGRGHALLKWSDDRMDYAPVSGDPIGTGPQRGITAEESYDLTIGSDYPDSFLQIARLADSPRSGEIILSASRDWDFRSKYEPIPHVSSHGALHRDHMLVPLLTNHPMPLRPRRTVDVMPSAIEALGLTVPAGLDGRSFFSAESGAS